jgi:hypothetical protein
MLYVSVIFLVVLSSICDKGFQGIPRGSARFYRV